MENTRRKLLKNKIELVDEIIEEIIELPAESEGMNELPSYTEKNYRELSAVEKEDLINSLMKDDYLKYKNCYISRSKLLYDSSETLIKEISALSQLNELGYEIYLLPYSYARDSMNFYKKSADSITYGDFLELKSTISTNERAGQNCYEAGRKQADNIYISFVNDISEEKALKSIYGSIGNIKKGNRKHNIEDNFKGLLFLNFEKKGEIHLYDISKEGYVTKIENPSFENLKKILEDNKISQVIVNPSNERRSPRDLNLHQDIESVNSKEYQNFQDKKMENYVITQERNGEITVLASSYKNAIFVGGDYLSDYETYNLEKVNNLLKDLQESNPDNEYKIMTENDFRQTYLLEENKLSPTEYLTEKINASGINIHLSKEEMKAILEAGKDVQKLAVKYGTNQNIESENENTFNGYGTYVVSVNEENARQLGIKIASRKYGGTFYINNQPLSQFLQEKNFSSYWIKRLEQLNTNSVDNLSHEIMMANVNGNAILEQEQNKLSTILSLDLIEYKREQTYLYSVEIPDNDNTNYLLYNNPIGIDQATKINYELQKMGVEWRASRSDIGKNIYFELLSKNVFNGNQKAASEFLKENVGFVGMQMDNANYIIFNDKDMSINNRVQYMKSENGEVYGFTFDGEIYIDEDLVNSNVLAHEYTHIWDNYVQKNNPDLWQKGMNCLKGTSLWYEITEDKNYENLRTDDEILSECHARIVGKMAEQVLERIAARDGELTKDKIIDWDREVNEYVATELLIKPELGDENYISESVKAEYLKEFLSMPMKDLMNEVRIQNYNQSNDIQEMRKNIEALKTPFGQNSKLNYKEWSFARSDEFKKQFGDWESIQKKNFLLSNETVVSLTGKEFSKKEGIFFIEQVGNFFKENTDNITSPFFGNVNLDKKGLKSSFHHGISRIKAIAYAAVPEVINNGVIIGKSLNHKNRGYDSYVVAAPIKIANQNYICEVVLKKDEIGTQFYLHEVTEQKKYLDRAFLTRRGVTPAQNPGTLLSLLDNIISVNSPVLCPMNENGEPEKSFVENELKKIQKYAETIDNSQTENLEESVEKSSHDTNLENSSNINNVNSLSPTEYLAQKINASGINTHFSKEEMKAIIEAGKDVQKMTLENANFDEMTFSDFEEGFKPKYDDYEVDCTGMGILSVPKFIEEIEKRNNDTILTVNCSDGSAYHTFFDKESWNEFKESANSMGISITKVWVTEEFNKEKNEKAFYKKREEYIENKNIKYMKSENGEVYGFTFDGEIYIDEDLVNSNVLAHEYTHIWDNYVQKNNPELWDKGMNCLKGTSLWYEITEDKNYENLRTDDEILSECHARIVGKMAEQVLERIAARDGELTKDKIIDWDKEVSEYVVTELLIKPELGDENYISESVKAEYLKEFLSMPMKDLMNELTVQMEKEKKVENEAIHLKSNIVEDMSEDIKDIYSKKEQFIKLNLSPASDWLIKKEKEVGIDISGYMHQITTDFMKHTLNNHGDEKSEEQRGNIAITEDDFTNIQSVFEKPDLVVVGLRRKNEDMIIYTKKLEDGTTVYMEEILSSKKNQALRSKTMYKSKNEISIEKLEKILRENKQNDCSKMIITHGEVAISSVSYSEPNSVGSQIQHPTGDGISLHQNNDIVNKNDIRKKLSVEGGRSSINHLDNQDSAASISARTDTEKLQQNNVVVNSLSESNTTAKIQKYAEVIDNSQTENLEEFENKHDESINELKKIQKYAETIDNSQTENPEESVEKSSKDIKPEISVVCGEIKSILGNKFTGGNIKLSQDFQHELIEKGLVNPEEEFVLINDAEAVAQGCKIKSDQPFVFLNIPVENNGKTDFVQTKYYHVSALEEPQKLEKNVEEAGNQNEAVDKNIIIYGETKVPEFAIITQHGLKTYSNLIIESYDPTSHSYLLQSEDGSQRLNITEETYNELMSNTFQEKAQSFTNDEPAYNKLLETQYNDYFKQRDNTAYNFKHNLSVYCRKEANSPCNALEIAKGIISRMSVEEKNKTKSLLKKIANGKTLNEVIVDIYHEAIKEVPLNEEYIKIKVPEKVIARPFYDTVSNNGQLISKDYNLKIGDTLKNVNISSEKLFGKGTENIKFDELKIISSSKEGNCITLMDSNKSFIEVPLDTVLSSYEKYKSNTQKIEKRNTVSMDISY